MKLYLAKLQYSLVPPEYLGWHPIAHSTIINDTGSWELFSRWSDSPSVLAMQKNYNALIFIDMPNPDKLGADVIDLGIDSDKNSVVDLMKSTNLTTVSGTIISALSQAGFVPAGNLYHTVYDVIYG